MSVTEIVLCGNCGHQLHELSGMFDGVRGTFEHFNRRYTRQYPYSTKECHAPDCNCSKPERECDHEYECIGSEMVNTVTTCVTYECLNCRKEKYDYQEC